MSLIGITVVKSPTRK